MFIKQLSVILENKKGTLADWYLLLAQNHISVLASTLVDTGEHGVLRAIVCDPETTMTQLRKANYAVSMTDVFAIPLVQEGVLLQALDLLRSEEIGVEYIYAFNVPVKGTGVIVIRTNMPLETQTLFEKHQIPTISQLELKQYS